MWSNGLSWLCPQTLFELMPFDATSQALAGASIGFKADIFAGLEASNDKESSL